MDIKRFPVTVKELVTNYKDNDEDGVTGYDDRLDIRPPYQREFVYNKDQQEAVINTIMNKLPLNVMYWARNSDDRYEIIDGQQRTISICRFVNGAFSYKGRYFHNLLSDEKEKILNYELFVYLCDGLESEKLAWFETINLAPAQLTKQELRNATFTGPWLSSAKIYFSKSNCSAYQLANQYMNGSPIRQDYLETVLSWIADRDKTTIDDYMGRHQHDVNAAELWIYFNSVITWLETIFTNKKMKKFMKGLPWGILYNKYGNMTLDTKKVDEEISKLWMDDDVTNKRGVFPYILSRDEKHLSIRKFSEAQKLAAYEKQKGICPDCGKYYEYDEMEADHIKPWVLGGKTITENCACRCMACNRTKGKK